MTWGKVEEESYFYPRPPQGGRLSSSVEQAEEAYISIHALRKEGDLDWGVGTPRKRISIHALRKEGDRLPFVLLCRTKTFLSTPSARRATRTG